MNRSNCKNHKGNNDHTKNLNKSNTKGNMTMERHQGKKVQTI